jgi:xylulokinase
MGVMLSAAESLRWLRSLLAPATPYDELFERAKNWPAGSEGLTFLPYLAGERTPHVDPDARAAFVGLSVRHDLGALVRAVLEGVAFGLRDCLDLVVGLGGHPRLGRASGGGARSDLWLQIVASALELPLERVAVDEGAAFGAAILAGVAAGEWPDVPSAVAATVMPRDRIDPVPEWVEAYRDQLAQYRALYPPCGSSAAAYRTLAPGPGLTETASAGGLLSGGNRPST